MSSNSSSWRDPFLSETAARADVVLPTAQWAEEDGTMTNLEGRVIRRAKAIDPPAGVRTDAHVLHEIAARLGSSVSFVVEAEAGFAELRRASSGGAADYAGISFERHRGGGRSVLAMPERHPSGDAAPFPRPLRDGGWPGSLPPRRASAVGGGAGSGLSVLAHDRPGFCRITNRARKRGASPTSPRPNPSPSSRSIPRPPVGLGLTEGDLAHVTTRRGTIDVKARLTDTIRLDTLFVPFHWGGHGSANLLTHAALDPESRMPEFKVCAAHITPTRREPVV